MISAFLIVSGAQAFNFESGITYKGGSGDKLCTLEVKSKSYGTMTVELGLPINLEWKGSHSSRTFRVNLVSDNFVGTGSQQKNIFPDGTLENIKNPNEKIAITPDQYSFSISIENDGKKFECNHMMKYGT